MAHYREAPSVGKAPLEPRGGGVSVLPGLPVFPWYIRYGNTVPHNQQQNTLNNIDVSNTSSIRKSSLWWLPIDLFSKAFGGPFDAPRQSGNKTIKLLLLPLLLLLLLPPLHVAGTDDTAIGNKICEYIITILVLFLSLCIFICLELYRNSNILVFLETFHYIMADSE